MAGETQTYRAISILNSKTFWWNAVNGLVAVLSLTEVIALVPPQYLTLHAAVIAAGNVWLRTMTVRPVAFIAPFTTTSVEVPKIALKTEPPATD